MVTCKWDCRNAGGGVTVKKLGRVLLFKKEIKIKLRSMLWRGVK